ncbi:MAG: peptidylprolyl isomerase [Candidatus Cryptobacteroides sp.]
MKRYLTIACLMLAALTAGAQKYPAGLIDKTVAVIGNEMITISSLEQEIQYMKAQGIPYDSNVRCSVLESVLESKLFLMQARIDSLTVNHDVVASNVNSRVDQFKTMYGGEEAVEEMFGKSIYKLRQEWTKALEDQNLTQQMQSQIAARAPQVTPYEVRKFVAETDERDMPIVPIRYQLSQICIYPDREAANLAVKEKLLAIRERIINGEKFATLARIYSEDPGSARKGGELGMASKSIFWPAFSDAAMALKPGVISQIVETPDGFHIIEVLEKKGDMFNARHILMKPEYTVEDREHAFHTLDSLRSQILADSLEFTQAARFYSQDPSTRTNGGQMADPNSGSSYFEIDQLKPQDYNAIRDLAVGDISDSFESLDNEGRSGNTVYKIIKVDNIYPSHTATLEEDYSLLSDAASNKAAMDEIDKFLNEKIASTHITIDPIFKDCEFSREAWKTKIVESE